MHVHIRGSVGRHRDAGCPQPTRLVLGADLHGSGAGFDDDRGDLVEAVAVGIVPQIDDAARRREQSLRVLQQYGTAQQDPGRRTA
ncbi:MAG: hypothetical protein BGN97_13335 [Microbacterium sp. 69-10]|nr:MAG: hypothetical protein BGN97_13335 [Microbacterium sp. 69-10]